MRAAAPCSCSTRRGRTATVYRGQGDAHMHSGEDTLDLSHAVPGWRVALGELFD